MVWIAPAVDQVDEPFTGPENVMLTGWLDSHRTSFLARCSGLTGEQLAQRSVPPSALSLLGLIRHLADVERTWFRIRFAGEAINPLYPGQDACFHQVNPDNAEAAWTTLIEEWDACRRAVANATLDETFTHPRFGQMSLRWLHIHMIREYAGHIGHADLLRERLDGTTFT